MKKIKLGFVGAGFNGQIGFLENFSKNKNCIIWGLAEYRPELRKKVCKKYNITNQYASHKDLVKNINEYDGIIIVTKRNMMPAIAYDFLKLGKPILTEKPMAMCTEQAKKLLKRAQKYHTRYKVGYNKTYDEGIQKAKLLFDRLFKSKSLGNLIQIRSHRLSGSGYIKKNSYIHSNEKNLLSKPSWKIKPSWIPKIYEKSYEKYLNLYCHNINLFKFFIKQKPKVAFSDLSDKKISTVVLDYGKFSAILETGFFTKDGWDETFDLYFEKGSLKITLPPQHLKNKSATFYLYKNKNDKIFNKTNFNSWSFKRQADAFVNDIKNKKLIHNNAKSAFDDIDLVEKIWRKFLNK